MKKIPKILALLFCIMVVNTYAQVEIKLSSAKSDFNLLEKSSYRLKVKTSFDKINTINVSTVSGNFIEIGCPGFTKIYNNGRPELPVLNKLIEVPYGAEMQVNIISYNEQTIDLAGRGIVQKIMPSQPSISKSANVNEIPFYYDQAFYQINAYNTNDIVSVAMSGIMRGVRMANLTIAPFRYNPVTNILKVYNDLVFEVVFKHPDIQLTEQIKEKYYSPYFESSLNALINHTEPLAKDALSKYPIKYVIVSLTTFQVALQPFVYWKRQKGFNVIEKYYTSAQTAATVKTYLQGLYTAGTALDPAPTFALIVGDVAQIGTNTGIDDNTTMTDLYTFTFDSGSDYIPDMYYGRFSATTTTHVTNQVNKTLLYEKYQMPSATYMDTVVMVAGYDSYGYDATYGNGQLNYGTNNYFNAAHGIYSYTYLDPNNTEAIAGAAMRANLYKGVGYANYTAHCGSSGWGTPGFSTSQIASMYNNNKYGLLVGNCCQSNTFYDSECFGEALLRAYSNKGAVGYIGASNYSYWDEDYYWGVGARSNITSNPTYNASALGAYDCIFHDKGQPKASWYYTNDQMRYAGLLAVEQSSSTMKQYYWEEYHLMGDPSVMNYFSVPDPLTVTYTDPQNVGISSLVVTTEEDAYVAISHAGVLLDAELAPAGGVTTLNFSAITQADTLDVVVTKQNKRPYIGLLHVIAASIPLDAQMVSINSPEASYNCSNISVAPQVTVRNSGTTTLTNFRITYQITGGSQQIYNWSGSLASGQSININLPAITVPSGASTFTAVTSLPNGLADQNQTNDSKSVSIMAENLVVSADFTGSATQSCTTPLSVTFTNTSANATSYVWDFGDGNTSTDANPTHSYTALGTYNVVLTSSAGICGSDVETKNAYITVGSDIPVATDGSRCGTGTLTLNATASGTIHWYDLPVAGTDLGTGNTFTTPSLTATTTYYAGNNVSGPTQTVGPTNSTSGGSYSSSVYSLIFDCYTPVTLVSVAVNKQTAGSILIKLTNSGGTVLQSGTYAVPAGSSTVTLNWSVPTGTGLRLVGPSSTSMYRLSSATYPYTLSGLISITGCTTSNRYGPYYNWQIKTADCISARTPVTATILSEPVAAFTSSVASSTVNFTNTSTNATSYLWAFGDGSTSTDVNPGHTYATAGTYTVTLIADNGNCSDVTTQNVTIQAGINKYTISGKTRYAAKANTGTTGNYPTYNQVLYNIDQVVVILKSYPGGIELARDTSDALGSYQFNNISSGTYLLSYDKYSADTMQWGNDENAIDVSLIKFLVNTDTLIDPSRSFGKKYKKAADVDNNMSVNAIDIARIKAKIGSPATASRNFPKGNWVALDTLVTVAGADVNANLKTICYADYNASNSKYLNDVNTWGQGKSLPTDIVVVSDEYITSADPTYFEVPLRINSKSDDFSTMGLELSYPQGFRLVSAYMPRADHKNGTVKINPTLDEIIAENDDLLVTDENNIVRVVYATINSYNVAANDELIRLGFRSDSEMKTGEQDFNLSGTGVIANKFGEESGNYLVMPKVFIQGNNTDAGFEFTGYPNPVKDEVTIAYNLPEAGSAELKVYNSIGELVDVVVNRYETKGSHTVLLNTKGLPTGIYTFRLEFIGKETSKSLVLKMIK